MKNIYSNIFKFNNSTLKKAIKYLKKNDVLGIPTETVYGIAGNAYSKNSIKKIYNIKKRPKINPLIIHYYNFQSALKDIQINDNFLKLYKKFSPGPITYILKKKKNSKISSLATANLNTVAVRFPKHTVVSLLLKNINFPLAMPSANKSTEISPVDVNDVREEFNKKLKMIIDGGRSKIGVESTVVDLTGKVTILRPGFISDIQIGKVLKKKISISSKTKFIKSPGNLKKHYSPGIPIKLNQVLPVKNFAYITFGKKFKSSKDIFNLSYKSSLNEFARKLYKTFRKIKKLKYKKIYICKIPNKGIGIAINDRLTRAAK